jgi:hypothetical protein
MVLLNDETFKILLGGYNYGHLKPYKDLEENLCSNVKITVKLKKKLIERFNGITVDILKTSSKSILLGYSNATLTIENINEIFKTKKNNFSNTEKLTSTIFTDKDNKKFVRLDLRSHHSKK